MTPCSRSAASASESVITRLMILVTRASLPGMNGRSSTRVLSGVNLTPVRSTGGMAGVVMDKESGGWRTMG